MTVYCLEMRSTESWSDVRYRQYTTSARRAEAFKRVPAIHFTDSLHKIVPHVGEHKGKRHRPILVLRAYVEKAMAVLLSGTAP